MRKRTQLASLALLAASAASFAGFTGCGSDDGEGGRCQSTEEYFALQVWTPILSQKCIGCHNPLGLAKDSKMVLKTASEAGFLDANLAIVKEVASYEKGGTSLLLIKPSFQVDHGGGEVVPQGSGDYAVLEELVARFAESVPCQPDTQSLFTGVTLANDDETLRKAAILLAGRLPTEVEREAVRTAGAPALDAVFDKLMTEDTFYERLQEIYNDLFLTDRYLDNEDAVNLLDDVTGYDAQWYDGIDDPAAIQHYGAESADDLRSFLRRQTNKAVAREPVSLVAYVVRNDRPYTEILTADYLLVNPYSAQAFGLTDVTFDNDADPDELREGHLPDFPHAGVLTSPMFLNRHTTTPTNRNRHRARMVYEWFLGTDILKTAEQPIDPTKITGFNPTLYNPSCTVCHANIDPIAGALHGYADDGAYDPDDPWLEDMRPPGFGGDTVPYDQFPTSAQWLGARVSQDPRFALSAVFIMYRGLTGHAPLSAPTDPTAADYAPRFRAYLTQYEVFSAIAADFVASGFNLKTVVKGILHTPYFRAKNSVAVQGDRALELGDVGMGLFLPPEQLDRKIQAVLGYPWRTRATSQNLLRNEDEYRILYGGIDSIDVTKRLTAPNGVMANIAERMANEMACLSVARDFVLPAEKRILFPLVETTYAPEDENGFAVDYAIVAIRDNIRHLHERILGETLPADDPEIERTYQLFLETWREGWQGLVEAAKADDDVDAYSEDLPSRCQADEDFFSDIDLPEDQQITKDEKYTIRAWMAVVTYLASDYRFLHE